MKPTLTTTHRLTIRRSLSINRSRRRRGVTMLGLLPLAMLLAVWCSIILDRSIDAYRTTAILEWRLQARAAAEGVAVMILEDPARPLEPQNLGPVTVICQSATPDGERGMLVNMDVAVDPPDACFTIRYRAHCVRDGAGWRLLRLEESA